MPSDTAPLVSGRLPLRPTLPHLLAVLLCAATTVLIVREGLNTLQLGQTDDVDAEVIVMSTVTRAQYDHVAPDTGPMIALHLFGRKPPEPVMIEEIVDAPIPETTRALQLVGVFTHTDPDQASAIIADDRGRGKTYRVGDRIDTRTQLQAVTRDSVILQTADVKEQLYFAHAKRPDVNATPLAITAQRAATQDLQHGHNGRRAIRAVMGTTASTSPNPQTNHQIRTAMQAKLKRWRAQAANNTNGQPLSVAQNGGP